MRHRLSRWSSQGWVLVPALALLAGCGEPVFENTGSPNSLLEDREACVMEMEKSPAAIAYRLTALSLRDCRIQGQRSVYTGGRRYRLARSSSAAR